MEDIEGNEKGGNIVFSSCPKNVNVHGLFFMIKKCQTLSYDSFDAPFDQRKRKIWRFNKR